MVVEINTLIARYIAENTRLIIPNIGTLLRRKESGEIVFMEMLKKGDGALNSLVGAHFRLSEADAMAAVENYAAEIKRAVESDKKFIMDGVGVLLAGANGNMVFIFNPSAHTIDAVEDKPKTTVEEKPVEVSIEDEQLVEEPTEEPTVVVAKEDVVEPTKESTVVIEESQEVVVPQPKADKVSTLYGDDEDEEDDEPKESGKAFDLSVATNNLRSIAKLSSKTTNQPAGKSKKVKLDGITILAIVSALIAIATLVWGMIPNRTPLDIDAPIEIVEGD